jgi:hypothetical protein
MMRRMPSAFAGASAGSALTAVGLWYVVSSTRPSPSGALHHGDVGPDVLEADGVIHPGAFDRRFAFHFAMSVREVAANRTLLSGLMRTATTDEHARRWFHRYWTFGVGSGAHILVGARPDSARRAAEGDDNE